MFSTLVNLCVCVWRQRPRKNKWEAAAANRPSGCSEEVKLPDGIRGSAQDLVCFSPSSGIPVSPAGFSQVLASIRVSGGR